MQKAPIWNETQTSQMKLLHANCQEAHVSCSQINRKAKRMTLVYPILQVTGRTSHCFVTSWTGSRLTSCVSSLFLSSSSASRAEVSSMSRSVRFLWSSVCCRHSAAPHMCLGGGGGKRLEGGGQGEGMGQKRGNNALSKIITVQDNTIDYGGSQQCCLLRNGETVIKCC